MCALPYLQRVPGNSLAGRHGHAGQLPQQKLLLPSLAEPLPASVPLLVLLLRALPHPSQQAWDDDGLHAAHLQRGGREDA